MAYKKKADQQKDFIAEVLAVGIESYMCVADGGKFVYEFKLKNGQYRYWLINVYKESYPDFEKALGIYQYKEGERDDG